MDENLNFTLLNGYLRIGNKIINTKNLDCIEFYLGGPDKFIIALNLTRECIIKYTFDSEEKAKDFFNRLWYLITE